MNSNVFPLYEGTFSVGVDKKFVEIHCEESAAKGALKISINPFLIKAGDRNYLFDAGIGEMGENTDTDTIKKNLEELGLTEYDITDIFCSHLHYDHIGGLAGRSSGFWQLTFPEADIWVSRGGWNKVMGLETYYDDEKTEFVHFLDAKADLRFLDDEEKPYPDIAVKKIGGHTEHSLLLTYENDGQKFMMAGDVLAARGQINRKYEAKYDFDPNRSMQLRSELTNMAYQENYVIMGYHENDHPLFRLTDYDENQGYTIEDKTEHVSA